MERSGHGRLSHPPGPVPSAAPGCRPAPCGRRSCSSAYPQPAPGSSFASPAWCTHSTFSGGAAAHPDRSIGMPATWDPGCYSCPSSTCHACRSGHPGRYPAPRSSGGIGYPRKWPALDIPACTTVRSLRPPRSCWPPACSGSPATASPAGARRQSPPAPQWNRCPAAWLPWSGSAPPPARGSALAHQNTSAAGGVPERPG